MRLLLVVPAIMFGFAREAGYDGMAKIGQQLSLSGEKKGVEVAQYICIV